MRLTRLFVAHLILVFSFWPALAQTAARNEPVAGGGSISGRVTGSGKPLVDVAVGIWRQPDVEPNAGNVAAVGRTDRDGTYELKAPAGKYFIAVRAEGFVVGNENEPVSKSLRPVALLKGSSLKVDFELAPAAAFEGAVTDDLGQPVPLAPIWLMPEGTPAASIPLRYSASIRTDLLGRYRIDGLPAGRYRVAAGDLAPVWDTFFGRLPHRRTFYPHAADQSQAKIVDIPPGAVIKHIDINMGPALRTFTARARLVADQNGPIPDRLGFMVEAFYQGQRAATGGPTETSTTNGEIVIPNLPPGEYVIHVGLGMRPLQPYRCPQIGATKLIGRSDHFQVIDRDVAFDLHISGF